MLTCEQIYKGHQWGYIGFAPDDPRVVREECARCGIYQRSPRNRYQKRLETMSEAEYQAYKARTEAVVERRRQSA